jgi:hypothetical protein
MEEITYNNFLIDDVRGISAAVVMDEVRYNTRDNYGRHPDERMVG